MNKFDEALKTLRLINNDYKNVDASNYILNWIDEVVKQIELGKLYKEYYDYFESQFNTDDVYVELVASIKNKIKELENEL